MQVIVCDHANLPDSWFEEAVGQNDWREGRKLIPDAWIKIRNPASGMGRGHDSRVPTGRHDEAVRRHSWMRPFSLSEDGDVGRHAVGTTGGVRPPVCFDRVLRLGHRRTTAVSI